MLLLTLGCAPLGADGRDGAFDDRCETPAVSVEALSSISCGAHTDTGYRAGSPFSITVVTIDGHPVERDTANAYYVMAEAASRAGVEIRVVSGFRTMAEQEHLYYCYTSCTCNGCNLAARPGHSNHQSGHALDLNTSGAGVYAWLTAHGRSYGFSRTVPSEAWHWEWWGGGPGGGPCVVARDDDGDGSIATADCDDHDARRTPGRAETCDGVDNDCDGTVDDHLSRDCGTNVGACVAGTETCSRGTWGSCEGAVAPIAESCDRQDDDCDGQTDEGQVCEREEALLGGVDSPSLDSDVSGDGLPDACARLRQGFTCLVDTGHGFDREVIGPALDALSVEGAARIRMADVDGDGRADVCAVVSGHLRCWRSTGAAFAESFTGPAVGDDVTSVELADVDGDGRIDACLRDAAGLSCWIASGHGFERSVTLAALSDRGGFANVIHHGTLRFGDVDGDGRTDVCARDASGVDCWLASSDGFGARVRGPRWSDASGFDGVAFWSTIRLVDVDGDARSDLCARTPRGFRCALALPDGTGFDEELGGPAMGDAAGWAEPSVYATLRMADVDGDGALDVCAREADRVRCWLYDGHAFDRVVPGPALPAADGWDRAAAFRSIRLADVDGDGRADLCGRSSDALRCYVSTGGGFDRVWVTPAWGDASGLGGAAASASIRLAAGPSTTPTSPAAAASMGCSAGTGRSSGLALVAPLALALWLRRVRRRGPSEERSKTRDALIRA